MRVVVLDDYQGVAAEMADWARIGPDLDLVTLRRHIVDPEELLGELTGAEVIVAMRERTPLSRELLAALPELKLVVTTGRANSAIDVPPHVLFCGTRSLSAPTAELTWALILAAQRHLSVELGAIGRGEWQTTIGTLLEGRTLGLIGLGNIGSRVAKIGAAFGMEVLAWSQNLDDATARERGALRVELGELLSRADVLSIHTRLSDRTRGLLGAAELATMKAGALLVNTSRAAIVDQAALLDALREQRIGGAALDVYDREPLPADSPLRGLPNVVLTPHLGYVVEQNYRLFFEDAVEAIVGFLEGEPVGVIPKE